MRTSSGVEHCSVLTVEVMLDFPDAFEFIPSEQKNLRYEIHTDKKYKYKFGQSYF